MNYERGDMLYEGKAKTVYQVKGQKDIVWLEFRDSLTAFNAQKKGEFKDKGHINREIATLIFRFLVTKGIQNHWIANVGETAMIADSVEIIPIEVVVRNRMAGSLAKRFGRNEGEKLAHPVVEFYFKKDELNDPFMNEDHALALGLANGMEEVAYIKRTALRVNDLLIPMFAEMDLELIDFKVEFGRGSDGRVLLADEITPDSCRLWDMSTGEKMDKDRFRRDLGKVDEVYKEVLQRMRAKLEGVQ